TPRLPASAHPRARRRNAPSPRENPPATPDTGARILLPPPRLLETPSPSAPTHATGSSPASAIKSFRPDALPPADRSPPFAHRRSASHTPHLTPCAPSNGRPRATPT